MRDGEAELQPLGLVVSVIKEFDGLQRRTTFFEDLEDFPDTPLFERSGPASAQCKVVTGVLVGPGLVAGSRAVGGEDAKGLAGVEKMAKDFSGNAGEDCHF